ncbi:MAG: Gfo/Idh/MocA family protein [Thermoprotei archaeon]|jgi:predicted dehydrogenase
MAIRVALLGHGFIAKAHVRGFMSASQMYGVKKPILQVVYGRRPEALSEFASRFGFDSYTTDLAQAIGQADLVDNCLPNHLHAPVTLEAVEKGKDVLLEKPMAVSVKQAEELVSAVRRSGVRAAIGFNYRFLPAISLAKKLISEGRLGLIHTFRAAYLQSYLADPNTVVAESGTLVGWRQKKELAGSGSLGDLGSHAVDLARYLVGDIAEVVSQEKILYPERPTASGEKIKMEVDDAFMALVKFRQGAMGSIEASRIAPGMKNQLRIEVHGNKGSVRFNLERPSELEVYLEEEKDAKGFRDVIVDDPSWWPFGHVLGWEHSVAIEVSHFMKVLEEDAPIYPAATFEDGLAAQKVIDAIDRSSRSGNWESVS